MKSKNYEELVEKFKPKHTTDDCYTPAEIYSVVADYVAKYYNLNQDNFARPFYPGGDFENFDYKKDTIVVDNPPFSIFSKIIDFYTSKNIKYFLFAPALTALASTKGRACMIFCKGNITYENGAKVNTCFVTNLEDNAARVDSTLKKRLKQAYEEIAKRKGIKNPTKSAKVKYPENCLTGAQLSVLSTHNANFTISKSNVKEIKRTLNGRKIFGGYFVLDEDGTEILQKAKEKYL